MLANGRPRRALVLGGAGFVGSAIALGLVRAGWFVDVVDSLEPCTFADRRRLSTAGDTLTFEERDIETVSDLAERFAASDLIVDAIGWTRHSEAECNPALDLRLNLAVHLALFQALSSSRHLFVLLGSRHQFGGGEGIIDDEATFAPLDVQSIHKCAAEHHLRRASLRTGSAAVALRLGNCIGPGQPVEDGDVGLVGGFVRDLSRNETVAVFDGPRRRNLCFTPDVAQIVVALASQRIEGFVPMNLPGLSIDIVDIADGFARALGRGSVVRCAMPPDIASREIGAGEFRGSILEARLPDAFSTPFDRIVEETLRGLVPAAPRIST